jgi:hypothetical protein
MKIQVEPEIFNVIKENPLKTSRQIANILIEMGKSIPHTKIAAIRDEYKKELKELPYFSPTAEWVDRTPNNHRECATYKDMFCNSFDSNEVVGKKVN